MKSFERGEGQYVQINAGGVAKPVSEDFPPVTQRVGQNPDPYKGDFTKYGTLRTTVQWMDSCNLRCPGCYARPYLPQGKSLNIIDNSRKTTPVSDFRDQLAAHGDQLKEVYFLGLEPTLAPGRTAEMMRGVHADGMTSVASTNGAYHPDVFDATFREGLETGQLHRINMSLDSMDETIHNRLRGRRYAYAKTLETIRHAVETGVPLQITMTVWADNYHTVLDSVEQLYDMGARGFVFHEGSLEGAPDHKDTITRRISPLAWRALTAKLEILKERYSEKSDTQHFLFPYIYFTEAELRAGVIGDENLTEQYLDHVAKLERGEDSNLPFVACPAVDVPQVYLFGNDGPDSQGAISLCNMHTIQTGTYLAHYDPTTQRFITVDDPAQNQMQQMASSPNLCPARPGVIRDGNPSDKYETEAGDIFHACRYISSNQFPFADKTFGLDAYDTFAEYYQVRWGLLQRDNTLLKRIDEIDTNKLSYVDKLDKIKDLASSISNSFFTEKNS